jgi:hypothetical protein
MNDRLLFETLLLKLQRDGREFFDPSFPEQDAFVKDTSRFVAAQCSRRAGKSNGLALKFFNTLHKHAGAFCPYIALTRESARNIMWPVLMEQEEIFKVGFTFTESNLTMTHPNGARLQLFGADMKNFIRRLKGIKTPGAAIDEAQDFGSHLQSLVDDVLTPTLTDYKDSWLAITGTPGPVPQGYFYDITEGRKYGFNLHEWTLLNNPYIDGKTFIDEIVKKRGWDARNPTYLREYCNQWVIDKKALLIDYDETKNHYEKLPDLHWNYLLGVDLGLRDADALAVIAWSTNCKEIYLVEEVITRGQDITELETQIVSLMNKYKISKIVMDTGGLGAKIAEEFTRRKHIPVHAADKKRKFENITFLNDWLRLGRFKARKDSRFAKDSYQLQIDWERTTPDRLVVRDTFHSDIIDAVLYAFKESPAFTHTEPEVKPKYGTKDWGDAEAKRMEEAALEYFQEQAEAQASDYF